ncbi:D-glycero-alpha-D-manno-heptose-1,7-bisphosphate 7-phosphatase [Streptomyces sp. 8N706]|uniref:D-glycero-alpha-D-manno-heptose-1,7-bisphosphate 7-phosphatase n=1 Tax=Streptomyces sp. 8N706 TaxID=3457416 RepID=UPI003FD0F99C
MAATPAPAAPPTSAGEPWLFGRGGSPAPRTGSGRGGHHALSGLAALLFDRDGTLVEDVPYNGDPALVRLMPGARAALEAVRARGLAVGVVSNQSGVARGLLTREQVEAVQRRVEALLGPFDVWVVCPHGPADGCGCRKPAPGLVHAACAHLGVEPGRAAVIGDIGADVEAARAAGARGVLVPTSVTRAREIAAAEESAPDLLTAVRELLAGRWAPADGSRADRAPTDRADAGAARTGGAPKGGALKDRAPADRTPTDPAPTDPAPTDPAPTGGIG